MERFIIFGMVRSLNMDNSKEHGVCFYRPLFSGQYKPVTKINLLLNIYIQDLN